MRRFIILLAALFCVMFAFRSNLPLAVSAEAMGQAAPTLVPPTLCQLRTQPLVTYC